MSWPADPEVLAKHCPELVRVVLETDALSTFLYEGLAALYRPRRFVKEISGKLVIGHIPFGIELQRISEVPSYLVLEHSGQAPAPG